MKKEKTVESRMIKVPKFSDSVINICRLVDSQRLPWPFIQDFKVLTGDMIVLGVDIKNIGLAKFEMREYEVMDKNWITVKLMYAGIKETYEFCFRFGPYTFIVQTRFNDPFIRKQL